MSTACRCPRNVPFTCSHPSLHWDKWWNPNAEWSHFTGSLLASHHLAPAPLHSVFCTGHPGLAIILAQTALPFPWKILGCRSRGALNPGAVVTGNISGFAIMQTRSWAFPRWRSGSYPTTSPHRSLSWARKSLHSWEGALGNVPCETWDRWGALARQTEHGAQVQGG